MDSGTKCTLSFLYALRMLLGLTIMLMAMTYYGGVFIAIIIFHFIGHFLFGLNASPVDPNGPCH